MKELLLSLLLQASSLSGLPWDGHSVPNIRQVSECTIIREFTQQPLSEAQCADMVERKVLRPIAYYKPVNDSLTLPETFDDGELGQMSILVHELVHFLQDQNDRFYDGCSILEAQAYEVQARWLKQVEGPEKMIALVEKTGRELKQCGGGKWPWRRADKS